MTGKRGWSSYPSSAPHEVVERDNGLHIGCVRVGLEPMRGNHREVDGVLRPRLFRVDFAFDLQPPVVFVRNREGPRRVFHLAQVDDLVIALNHQVDLRPVFGRSFGDEPPSVGPRHNARDAELALDRVDVLKRDPLEGESAPDTNGLRRLR